MWWEWTTFRFRRLAQNRLGASLGTVWKSEQPALESMSLVFGLIVWKRGGWVVGQQISRGNECCKTGVLSTFGQKKSLQTRFLSLQVPDEGKKKWFQKAPKLKKCRKQASTKCSSQKRPLPGPALHCKSPTALHRRP